MNTLEEVLSENGWEKAHLSPNIPAWIPPQFHNERINITKNDPIIAH